MAGKGEADRTGGRNLSDLKTSEARCYCGRELHPDEADFESGWGGPACPHETVWDALAGPIVFGGLAVVFGGWALVSHWLGNL